MAIKAITCEEFAKFGAHRQAMLVAGKRIDHGLSSRFTETEWYASEDDVILGAVLLDGTDQDWSFVILGRDTLGEFRCIKADACLPDATAARVNLISDMLEIEKTGQKVFPVTPCPGP